MSASENEDSEDFGAEDDNEYNSDDTDSDDTQNLVAGLAVMDSVESYCLVLSGLLTKMLHARGPAKLEHNESHNDMQSEEWTLNFCVMRLGNHSSKGNGSVIMHGGHRLLGKMLIYRHHLRLKSSTIANIVYCIWCLMANPVSVQHRLHVRKLFLGLLDRRGTNLPETDQDKAGMLTRILWRAKVRGVGKNKHENKTKNDDSEDENEPTVLSQLLMLLHQETAGTVNVHERDQIMGQTIQHDVCCALWNLSRTQSFRVALIRQKVSQACEKVVSDDLVHEDVRFFASMICANLVARNVAWTMQTHTQCADDTRGVVLSMLMHVRRPRRPNHVGRHARENIAVLSEHLLMNIFEYLDDGYTQAKIKQSLAQYDIGRHITDCLRSGLIPRRLVFGAVWHISAQQSAIDGLCQCMERLCALPPIWARLIDRKAHDVLMQVLEHHADMSEVTLSAARIALLSLFRPCARPATRGVYFSGESSEKGVTLPHVVVKDSAARSDPQVKAKGVVSATVSTSRDNKLDLAVAALKETIYRVRTIMIENPKINAEWFQWSESLEQIYSARSR